VHQAGSYSDGSSVRYEKRVRRLEPIVRYAQSTGEVVKVGNSADDHYDAEIAWDRKIYGMDLAASQFNRTTYNFLVGDALGWHPELLTSCKCFCPSPTLFAS